MSPWPGLCRPPPSLSCAATSSPSCADTPRLGQPATAALAPPSARYAGRRATGHRGQAATSYLRLNRAVPWMRVVPPVLVLPFSSACRRRCSPAEDGRGHSRLCAWPGGRRQALAEPSRSLYAHGCGDAPPHLLHRRCAAGAPESASPAILCSGFRPGASCLNSTKIKGLNALSLTQVNSTSRDLFVLNRLKV